jgi:hypothetical protein
LEEAYDFSSLLFSPPQLTVAQTEQITETINPPTLPKINNQNHQMSRMRGKVESTTEDSRTRKFFYRTTVMPLEIRMQNMWLANIEEAGYRMGNGGRKLESQN